MTRGKALKAKNPTAAAPESDAPTTSHAPAKAQPSRAALAISAGKENAVRVRSVTAQTQHVSVLYSFHAVDAPRAPQSAALAGVMKVFHRATKPVRAEAFA